MSLNSTPAAERIHIGFFGRRNAGKSSLVNAVTGQNISVVSDFLGTTTDPVYKAMELLPLGPVIIIDTPGIDDSGELGEQRIKKTLDVLKKTDIAVLVVDSTESLKECDNELIELFKEKKIPFIIVYNKYDLSKSEEEGENKISVSSKTGYNIENLKNLLGKLSRPDSEKKLISDLLSSEDLVVLVVPIDSSAPKGRLILPQQQTIRDILEAGAASLVVRDTELTSLLSSLFVTSVEFK